MSDFHLTIQILYMNFLWLSEVIAIFLTKFLCIKSRSFVTYIFSSWWWQYFSKWYFCFLLFKEPGRWSTKISDRWNWCQQNFLLFWGWYFMSFGFKPDEKNKQFEILSNYLNTNSYDIVIMNFFQNILKYLCACFSHSFLKRKYNF